MHSQAGVDRVSLAMDDASLGEQQVDQPDPVEIEWRGHPRRLRRDLAQQRQTIVREVVRRFGVR